MYTEELIKRIAKKMEVDINKFNMNELIMGMEVELEHGSNNEKTDIGGDDPEITLKIVLAHMNEMPDYYTKLKGIEKKSKKELSVEARRFMSLAGIKEDKKKFLKNESFLENQNLENDNEDDDFIIHEFEQIQFEPGESDDLYNLKKTD